MKRRSRFIVAACAAAVVGAPALSRAANATWTFNGSGSWSVASNWLGGVPIGGSAVTIQHVDSTNRTITYNYTGASIQLAGMMVDNTSTGSSIFSQSANTYNSVSLTFGNTGKGYLNLSGGAENISGLLQFGSASAGRGFGTISGGTLNSGSIVVGESGQSTLTQNAGFMSAANFILGDASVGRGTFNLSGGVATFGNTAIVGNFGQATLTQSGGTFSAGGTLILGGATFNANGIYNLQNGTLLAASQTIGGTGRGSFVQTSGLNGGFDVGVFSFIDIGSATSSSGTYTLSGTGSLQAFEIFVGDFGFGTFIQNTGLVDLEPPSSGAAGLVLGEATSGNGTYQLNSGTLHVSGAVDVGDHGGNGTFIQTGGEFTVSGASGFNSYIQIGGGNTGTGQYFLSGSGSVSANDGILVGSGPLQMPGIMTVNGGTATSATGLFIGSAPGTVLHLGGGMLSIGTLSTGTNTTNFDWTAGTVQFLGSLNLATGAAFNTTVDLGPLKTLVVTTTTSGNGSLPLILDGGIFQTGSLANGALFQFNRGTFRLTSASLTVGTSGLFGSTVQLNTNQHVEITNGPITIDPGALLYLAGGSAMASGGVTNNGQIQLLGPVSLLSGGSLTNNGLIGGTGRISSSLNNSATGSIRVLGSDQLQFSGPANTNNGQINLVDGGQVEFTQPLTNSSTGVISGRGVFITGGTGLANGGNLALSAGITDVHGDIANNSGGRITVSGEGNVTFWDDVTNNPGGSIKVSPASVATFFGTYAGGGITGGGNVYFESDISPGFSPAAIGIAGNANFGSSSKLKIELAGHTRGTQYDAVDITGAAALDGSLTVSALGGFIPLPGDQFSVLTFASRSGDMTIDNQTGFAGLSFIKSFTPTSLTLTASGLGGDANLDGKVDIRDLLLLATHYQGSANWLGGDFDGTGVVDSVDLGLLAHNWQAGVGTASGPSLQAELASLGLPAVSAPEPVGAGALGLAGFLLLRRRRSVRREY